MLIVPNNYITPSCDLPVGLPDLPGRKVGEMNGQVAHLKAGALVGKFEGLNTFLDYMAEYLPLPRYARESSRRGTQGKFNVFETYEACYEAYRNNPASLAIFQQKDEQLEGPEDPGQAVEFDVTGDFLDIGRYLEGEPEHFGNMIAGNPRGLRVNITLDMSWRWDVAQATINARSKRILRLIDWLESQQIRTSVTVIESTQCGHVEIAVKTHDQQLSINDIAVISHSDFLRRIIFRWKEYSKTITSKYGIPGCLLAMSKTLFLPEYENEYSIFVGGEVRSIGDVNSQFDALESRLAAQLQINESYSAEMRSLRICTGEPSLTKGIIITGWGTDAVVERFTYAERFKAILESNARKKEVT